MSSTTLDEALAITSSDIRWELAPPPDTTSGDALIDALVEAESYRRLAQAAIHELHRLAGDDLGGYWWRVEADVAAGRHRAPQSVVARLRREIRLYSAQVRRFHAIIRQLRTPSQRGPS